MTCKEAVRILRRWRQGKLPQKVQHLIFKASAHVTNCRCESCSGYHHEELNPYPTWGGIVDFPVDRAPSVSTAR